MSGSHCLEQWLMLHLAPATEAKQGAQDDSVLAAMDLARQARKNFIAGLTSVQQQNVSRLLEHEKRKRKMQLKKRLPCSRLSAAPNRPSKLCVV